MELGSCVTSWCWLRTHPLCACLQVVQGSRWEQISWIKIAIYRLLWSCPSLLFLPILLPVYKQIEQEFIYNPNSYCLHFMCFNTLSPSSKIHCCLPSVIISSLNDFTEHAPMHTQTTSTCTNTRRDGIRVQPTQPQQW